jgi:4-diphosphocytidyl-2-C-methyl-D-erythritol kinase
MVAFPNAKINLGLYITGKRPDGYHNLETVFFPIALKDVLEIIESKEEQPVIFSSSGLIVNGDADDNLCVKAYQLLKKDFPSIPHIKMHLHKVIPMGAGMGGGSSDAAFTLMMLNEKFSLGISQQQLLEYALILGSDCPFFIINKPCLAKGRGEKLTEMPLSLSAYQILIVNPGIHVNTAMAFRELKMHSSETNLETEISKPVTEWKFNIQNDFEVNVGNAHPEILAIKEKLYESGAIYSSMSGSGSSVFGIFENKINLENNFPETYFYKWV